MSDPFGALAMQARGDTGIHDGAQYRESSRLDGSFPAKYGNGTDTFFAASARMLEVTDGSATKGVSTQHPTVKIMRYEHFTGTPINAVDPQYNAAFVAGVDSLSGNLLQPTGVYGSSFGYAVNGNYTVGVYGNGVLTGGATGGAMGVYGRAVNFVATGSAVSFGGECAVFIGANVAYNSQGNTTNVVGIDLPVTTGDTNATTNLGTYYAGAAVQIRPGPHNDKWDVGISITPGAVNTAGYIDQSAVPVSVDIFGDHGTAGIRITQNNGSHYLQRWARTTATAAEWGLSLNSSGQFGWDEVGVAQKFYIINGTPGANFTDLFIQEGAGPTLRRLKTFDPGVGGFNFVGGELVCILV